MDKIDHPSRDPEYAKAVAAGKRNAKNLKFESEGMRRDYERAIASNPINVYGLPQFAPAIVPKFSLYGVATANDNNTDVVAWVKSNPITVELYCKRCEKIVEHGVDIAQSFCSKCGKIGNYTSSPMIFN